MLSNQLSNIPQTLQKEIQGHQPRIDDIQAHGTNMSPGKESEMDRERRAALDGRLAELRELWALLISETEQRNVRLAEANRAQQFYTDAAEAEAWMGEQELHMMSEEKAKVSLCVFVTGSQKDNASNRFESMRRYTLLSKSLGSPHTDFFL